MTNSIAVRVCILTVLLPLTCKSFYSYEDAVRRLQDLRNTRSNLQLQLSMGNDRIRQLEQEKWNYELQKGQELARLQGEVSRLVASRPVIDLSVFNERVSEAKKALQSKHGELDAEISKEFHKTVGTEEQREISRLNREIRGLMAEKERALQELRSGRFCSECGRPASRIERETNTSFEQHLNDVQGYPKAATPAQIAKTRKFYDDKINSLKKQIDRENDSIRRKEAAKAARIESLKKRKVQAEQQAARKITEINKARSEALARAKESHQRKIDTLNSQILKLIQDKATRLEDLYSSLAATRESLGKISLQLIQLTFDIDQAESQVRYLQRREMDRLAREEEARQRLIRENERDKALLAEIETQDDQDGLDAGGSNEVEAQLSGVGDRIAESKKIFDQLMAEREAKERERQRIDKEMKRLEEEMLQGLADFHKAYLPYAHEPDALTDAFRKVANVAIYGKDKPLPMDPLAERINKMRVDVIHPFDFVEAEFDRLIVNEAVKMKDEIIDTLTTSTSIGRWYKGFQKKWNDPVKQKNNQKMYEVLSPKETDSISTKLEKDMLTIVWNDMTIRSDIEGFYNRKVEVMGRMYDNIINEAESWFDW